MQNAFIAKGGMVDLFGWDPSFNAPVVERHQKLIPACRSAGIKVIYIKMSYNSDYSNSGGPDSPNWHKELGLVMMRRSQATPSSASTATAPLPGPNSTTCSRPTTSSTASIRALRAIPA
jgi:nicotinamidase-related amidase